MRRRSRRTLAAGAVGSEAGPGAFGAQLVEGFDHDDAAITAKIAIASRTSPKIADSTPTVIRSIAAARPMTRRAH
jgi:hypothetical protein